MDADYIHYIGTSRFTYLNLWFDGHKDVWKQRLRPQRAVESDNTSQEGPKHHDDVDVSEKTDKTVQCCSHLSTSWRETTTVTAAPADHSCSWCVFTCSAAQWRAAAPEAGSKTLDTAGPAPWSGPASSCVLISANTPWCIPSSPRSVIAYYCNTKITKPQINKNNGA